MKQASKETVQLQVNMWTWHDTGAYNRVII